MANALLQTLPLCLLLGCQPTSRADLVLYNGQILTLDDQFSIHRSIAVRDGKVVAVGGDELAQAYRATRAIDLEGRTVLPGFNDTHIHVSGSSRRSVDLAGTPSLAALRAKIAAKAAELGAGEWVTGRAWSEDEFAERRRPLRGDLDEAAPNNPVILWRAGGHSVAVNSLALERAGITRETPEPESGVIERNADGSPNGIIRERSDLVSRLVPPDTPEDLRDSFVDHLRALLELGITSIVAAGATIEQFAEWETVYRAFGNELPRAAVQIRWAGPEAMQAFGRKTGDGDERLRVGAVKVLVDGGFTGPAAYTLEPYKGQPDYFGKLNFTESQLYDIVRAGHEMGWQMGFHTIGDGAIKMTVDVFDRVLAESPRPDHRHYLNHFTVMPPDATLRTMARDSILLSQQPNFTYTLEGRYVANLQGERLQTNNPVATPMSYGIFVALSSDVLPIGPMVGLYAAVTRKGISGEVYGAGERIGIRDAIRAYTRNAAYFTWEEDIKGTLEPGKLADLIVADRDLLTIDPEQLLDVRVDLTVLGGKVVYERDATTPSSSSR